MKQYVDQCIEIRHTDGKSVKLKLRRSAEVAGNSRSLNLDYLTNSAITFTSESRCQATAFKLILNDFKLLQVVVLGRMAQWEVFEKVYSCW